MVYSILAWSIALSLGYLTIVAAAAAILALKSGGRREDRIVDHDALAFSRFTIPVSIVVPLDGSRPESTARESAASRTIGALLNLNYPEFEVIVVADGPASEHVKAEWRLEPIEFFYRQVLTTGEVRRIYRSARDARLLFVEKQPHGRADAMNCGINLARYRYAAVVGSDIVFDSDALLRAMSAPLAEPASVIAASSHVECGAGAGTFESLGSFRAFLDSRVMWTRMRNGIGPDGAVIVWRRDALVQAGGFAETDADSELAMMTRLQQSDSSVEGTARTAIVRTAAIFGRRDTASTSAATARDEAMAEAIRALRRRARSAELAYLLVSRVFTPVVALWAVFATAAGAAGGWLPWRDVVLAVAVVSFAQALVSGAALLVRGAAADPPDERALRRLLVLAPCEAVARGPFAVAGCVRGVLRGGKPARR